MLNDRMFGPSASGIEIKTPVADNRVAQVAYGTINSALIRDAVAFIAPETGSLKELRFNGVNTSFVGTLYCALFTDSANGVGPSTTQVGSNVTLASTTFDANGYITVDLSAAGMAVTEGLRYWLVLAPSAWTSGSIAQYGNYCAEKGAAGFLSSITELAFYKSSDGGSTWAVSGAGYFEPFLTIRSDTKTFGFPFNNRASNIGSAVYHKAYGFLPGLKTPVKVAGIRVEILKTGTPANAPKGFLKIGGRVYQTLPVPSPVSIITGYTQLMMFFQEPVVVPEGTPIGIGVGGVGDTSAAYWGLQMAGIDPLRLDMPAVKPWNGWADVNGVITQHVVPTASLLLDQSDPFPDRSINRRRFLNAR